MKQHNSFTKNWYIEILSRITKIKKSAYRSDTTEQLEQAFKAFLKAQPKETKKASLNYWIETR